MICSKCSQSNPAEAAFCLNCAEPLTNQPPFSQPQTPQNSPMHVNASGQSQKGLISLILAIAGLFCCGPFTGVPAAILGWMELDAIKSGRSSSENKWMAMAGLWGGIASAVIHIGGYVLWILMGMLSAATADPYYY